MHRFLMHPIRRNSECCSVGVKTIICCFRVVGPLYMWAPILAILQLRPSQLHASATIPHVFNKQYAEWSPDQFACNGEQKNISSLFEHQILGAKTLVTLFVGLTRFLGVVKTSLQTAMFVREKLILLKDICCPCNQQTFINLLLHCAENSALSTQGIQGVASTVKIIHHSKRF